MTTNCDVLTYYVIRIWESISHQSSESMKPKQSGPTGCCLKVPRTHVHVNTPTLGDGCLWRENGANGLGGLHHEPKSNHRHLGHIDPKKEKKNQKKIVRFKAGQASKMRGKERKREGERRVNKPSVPHQPQNSSFAGKKKKDPKTQRRANLIQEE